MRSAACKAVPPALLLPAAASANSSWHWLGDDPTSLLPIAVVLTISIELGIIVIHGKVPRKAVMLLIGAASIVAANMVSYILPYASLALEAVRVYGRDSSEALSWAISKGPFYIIRPMSLILMLVCEYPVVYFSMRWAVKDMRVLSRSIIIANVITTALVALMERIIIRGSW